MNDREQIAWLRGQKSDRFTVRGQIGIASHFSSKSARSAGEKDAL